MGLLTSLLTLPVSGPVHGLQFLLEQIREQALAELMTEEQIQTRMIEASMQHQAGQMSDEEYREIEDHLLEQLNLRRQLSEPEMYDEPNPPGEAEQSEIRE